MRRRMPAAVIFDNDGLTLDTEHTWTRAEARSTRATAPSSRSTTSARCSARRARSRRWRWSATSTSPGRGAELHAELRELVHAELDGAGVEPMPGALELIAALREQRRPDRPGDELGPRVRHPRAAVGRRARPLRRRRERRGRRAPEARARRLPRGRRRASAPTRRRCVALEDSRDRRRRRPRGGHDASSACRRSRASTSAAANLVAPSLADPRVWELLELLGLERPVP